MKLKLGFFASLLTAAVASVLVPMVSHASQSQWVQTIQAGENELENQLVLDSPHQALVAVMSQTVRNKPSAPPPHIGHGGPVSHGPINGPINGHNGGGGGGAGSGGSCNTSGPFTNCTHSSGTSSTCTSSGLFTNCSNSNGTSSTCTHNGPFTNCH